MFIYGSNYIKQSEALAILSVHGSPSVVRREKYFKDIGHARK